ncbi:hypothetical protein M441DRAFT_359209 [Trichoderma asperellum CBS 433.97]|uniref:RING-type E3 ubiquitin transferase n=1 Tax=Trichoderma asperellum (strain ATCC 204424 / CBS 433.97 / NBRC 101777) TaxID=1042311 RepID=A0A2T3ZDC1_TRIA4|nr:hypothetical protein M441DRAFT_359209 [Trichoderma asperellum CBS 433.97]PTB42799.1 hypothetical protein M441DRAFT_359209 [Trichoderma asperellum CBS 433.97]
MDSPGHSHGHLEATPSREVVYCHACSNEWYRVDHGLVCPGCTSEATEIISSDSDPRDFNDGSASTSPEPHDPFHFHNEHGHDHDHDHDHGPDGHDHSHDSDPDEADIEEHMIPPGFHYRRSVLERPGVPHHDPDVDPVFERFIGLIHDLAPPPRRTGGSGMFQQRGGEEGRFGGPHIHRATFTNGSGSASVTIFSGPSSGFFSSGSPTYDHHGDPFQAFFNNVLRDEAPPGGGREASGGNSPGFARGLQEILNLFNPAHAISGDAVYSQEALDQIITNLMEAHPQSNAAPPASTEALANLNRRPVDASMLDGESKTECTICIDDMKVGDLAAFLPCKHWFHEACVVLWLKEHNTCPVCRASIEKSGEGNSGANANANASGPSGSGSSQSDDQSGSGLDRSGPLPIPGARPSQLSRPPSQSQSRLNEAMRSISSRQQERQQQQERERERYRVWGVSSPTERQRDERERERSRLWGVRSSSGYDTSRMQRRSSRNSLSPTSPRMTLADYRERQRQESPPQSGRRDGDNADTGRQTATSGALNWLRDRFTGGGSRDDSNRDDR